jgi:hypothetical protein
MRIAIGNAKLVLFAVLCFCVGCGTENGGSSSGQINIAGNWHFTFTSSRGPIGNASGSLTQSGGVFGGTLTLTGGVCASSGTIGGSIIGNNIGATLSENGQAVNLTGTVASNGQSASGTYTAAAGGCTNGDSGTWSGSDPSASGSFAGTLHPADLLPVGLSLSLKDEDGNISGWALFTNSVCFGSMKVMGEAVGSNLHLKGDGSGGTVTMRGIVDASGTALNLESEVSGICQDESGPGTLHKVQ